MNEAEARGKAKIKKRRREADNQDNHVDDGSTSENYNKNLRKRQKKHNNPEEMQRRRDPVENTEKPEKEKIVHSEKELDSSHPSQSVNQKLCRHKCKNKSLCSHKCCKNHLRVEQSNESSPVANTNSTIEILDNDNDEPPVPTLPTSASSSRRQTPRKRKRESSTPKSNGESKSAPATLSTRSSRFRTSPLKWYENEMLVTPYGEKNRLMLLECLPIQRQKVGRKPHLPQRTPKTLTPPWKQKKIKKKTLPITFLLGQIKTKRSVKNAIVMPTSNLKKTRITPITQQPHIPRSALPGSLSKEEYKHPAKRAKLLIQPITILALLTIFGRVRYTGVSFSVRLAFLH